LKKLCIIINRLSKNGHGDLEFGKFAYSPGFFDQAGSLIPLFHYRCE
jgi:hypothetical protein